MRARLLLLVAAVAPAACSNNIDLELANRAVRQFHELLSTQQFQRIYSEAGFDWKNRRGRMDSVRFLATVRQQLGAYRSSAPAQTSRRTFTGGAFVTLEQDSVYEHGKAREHFLYRINGQQAQLAAYSVTFNGRLLK